MKFAKHFAAFLLIILITLSLTGCSDPAIVSKTPTDVRFTPQHQETITEYKYQYDWLNGDFILVPFVRTEIIPDKYEVCYLVEYADGSTTNTWETVTKAEYDKAIAEFGGQS